MIEQEIRVRHEDLLAAVERVLANAGAPDEVAKVEAELMVEGDLLGVPSHGVRVLPGLVKGIREGRATAAPQLRIVRERAATCVLDCDNGPGRYTSVRAMEQAVRRARQFGVGVCMAIRTTHWGRAHHYAYRAAQQGMIGLCTTNAIPNMLAWGSTKPLLGNNPLAIGAPRGEGEDPVVLDMAMSQAAVGKIGTYLREGKKVPPGWGLDADGQPTDDPAAILASRSVLAFGEHKGAGLALMMELLTGALSGTLLSYEIEQRDGTGLDPESSKFFLAVDVTAFTTRERFAQKVDQLLAFVRAEEPGLGVLYPGERGWQTRERYLKEGIPIHGEIAKQLAEIGLRF